MVVAAVRHSLGQWWAGMMGRKGIFVAAILAIDLAGGSLATAP
jgi:hypothetical protein